MSMDAHLLLGIDMDLSPVTRYALRSVGEFFAQASPRLSIFLLTVIPVPYTASPSLVSFWGLPRPLSPTFEQHRAAERALCSARKTLEHYGIAPECIQVLIRVGIPADEIVAAAQELRVDWIAIGMRGNSLVQRLRRVLLGSTSRRVLEHAPCPVIIVTQLHNNRCSDLVAWYEQAITRSLREHADSYTILTARDVAFLFPPPESNVVGRKELDAATLALEHLVSSGVLFRYEVKGEVRYIND
jgi:nucleotide-binding universal stress UspA family protein